MVCALTPSTRIPIPARPNPHGTPSAPRQRASTSPANAASQRARTPAHSRRAVETSASQRPRHDDGLIGAVARQRDSPHQPARPQAATACPGGRRLLQRGKGCGNAQRVINSNNQPLQLRNLKFGENSLICATFHPPGMRRARARGHPGAAEAGVADCRSRAAHGAKRHALT